MAIPEFVKKSAEKALSEYIASHVPPCMCHEIRLRFELEEGQVTLFQDRRDTARPGMWLRLPVAQFRFNEELVQWTLHYHDEANRWRFYLNASPTLNLGKLLKVVDDDVLNVFWEV